MAAGIAGFDPDTDSVKPLSRINATLDVGDVCNKRRAASDSCIRTYSYIRTYIHDRCVQQARSNPTVSSSAKGRRMERSARELRW